MSGRPAAPAQGRWLTACPVVAAVVIVPVTAVVVTAVVVVPVTALRAGAVVVPGVAAVAGGDYASAAVIARLAPPAGARDPAGGDGAIVTTATAPHDDGVAGPLVDVDHDLPAASAELDLPYRAVVPVIGLGLDDAAATA